MDRSRRWVKVSKTPKQELDLPIKYRTKNQCVFTDQIVKYKWRMSLPYSPLLEFQFHFQWNARIFSIKWTKLWLKIGSRKTPPIQLGSHSPKGEYLKFRKYFIERSQPNCDLYKTIYNEQLRWRLYFYTNAE